MRKITVLPLYLGGLAVLLGGGFVAIAAAGDDEQHTNVRVIKHLTECESDDCSDSKADHHKIIIKCEGDGCDETDFAKHVFIGKNGEVQAHGKSDVNWVSSDSGHFNFNFQGLHSGKGGFLGVELNELSPELREHFGVPGDIGVMVSKVLPDSPAAKAGVQVGDIISALDGEEINSGGSLARGIRSHDEGDTVDLEVWRGGELEKLSAGIEVRDAVSKHPRAFAFHNQHGDNKNIEVRRLHADESDFDFDCGTDDDCTVVVKCHDGGCDCTVNGDTTDCAGIPGVPHQGE